MTNVLVTGITGNIGQNLAEKLFKEGYDVFGISRIVSNRDLSSLRQRFGNDRVILGDVTDYASVLKAFRKSDPSLVMHLAAISPVMPSFEIPFQYINTNFIGTVNVVQAFLEHQEDD